MRFPFGTTRRRGPLASLFLSVLVTAAIAGCVEQSTNPVVFDQILESTTVENKLLTPIQIFRNGAVLDTLPARTTRTYPLNRKGIFGHAWRIIAPLDANGRRAGIEPRDTFGLQYQVAVRYVVTNETHRTIFTPRIANLSFRDVRLTANRYEADEFVTSYVIPSNSVSSVTHAPYYYWNERSNVELTALGAGYRYFFSRLDTNFRGEPAIELESNSSQYDGSGVTRPLTIQN
jgi:hypothetical protein